MLVEGEPVIYKGIQGTIAFICETSVSISISGSNDVRIVVGHSDFDNIIRLNEK
jgi:hypothetical protein